VCNLGYLRPATSPATSGTYNLPAEHVGKKYRTETTTGVLTGGLIFNYTTGHNAVNYDRFVTSSGGTSVRVESIGDDSCEKIAAITGTLTRTLVEKRASLTYVDGVPTYVIWVAKDQTEVYQWGAGYDDGNGNISTADQGLYTKTKQQRSSRNDPLVTTVFKAIADGSSLVSICQFWGYEVWDPYDYHTIVPEKTYTNTPTSEDEEWIIPASENNASDTYTGKMKLTSVWGDWTFGKYRIIIPHGFDPPPFPEEYTIGDEVTEAHAQKWHGTWHNVELIETFTPAAGSPPVPVLTEKTLVWDSGGGVVINYDDYDDLTQEQKDERVLSWKSDWMDMVAPTVAGAVTVAIERSQCYHGAPWVVH
jgi:hypothetical protein